MERLGRRFFERYTPTVARELLGCILVRDFSGQRLCGRIVEDEAYRGHRDPASHAYRGITERNAVMFGRGGVAYVYLSYGVNNCLNVTTEPSGRAGAVLIRALEPVEGLDEMRRRRGLVDAKRLARGPGNLTTALGIDRSMNGVDMVTSNVLFLEGGEPPKRVSSSPRVGVSVSKERMWRYFEWGNPFVSVRR